RQVEAGAQEPFEQVREELAREQAQADRERAYSELTGRLTDVIYQNPSTLDSAARETGLQVQKLGPFSRDQTIGVAASPEVKRAAFSESLIEDGTASDPIEIGPSHSVVIRVIDHAPEEPRPLAEVRDTVVAAVRADRRGKAAVAAAEALVERLRAGEALADVAAAANAEVVPLDGLPRGAPVPTAAANDVLFEAALPVEGTPSVGRFGLEDGRQAVFVLTAVHPGDPAKLTPEQRTQLRAQLAQIDGTAAADDYVRRLRERFIVVVEESQL